ncbi:MAG TPA: hypothetical protein VKY31_13535, partial [Terriglobia bacterium]|nr:hypothetical protein [Terriglobia bacterium]
LALKASCRASSATAFIFFGGGLALAGLPPFGTFFGSSALEDAAKSSGQSWLSYVIAAAGILTGGAVLRCACRIFFGLGQGAPKPASESQDDAEQPGPVSLVMTVPALGILALSALIAIPHSFRDAALQAAIRMQDHDAYAARVLYGAPTTLPANTSSDVPPKVVLKSIAIALIACAAGWFALAERFRTTRRSLSFSSARSGMKALRALHSGVVGDYVVWIVAGVVAIGVVLVENL